MYIDFKNLQYFFVQTIFHTHTHTHIFILRIFLSYHHLPENKNFQKGYMFINKKYLKKKEKFI